MGKVMYRVFLGFIALVLVLGIAMVTTGSIVQRKIIDQISEKSEHRENLLQGIAQTYAKSGTGDVLNKAVDAFLQQIPKEVRESNNIVLLDSKGTILYRCNDHFLRTDVDKLSLYAGTASTEDYGYTYGAMVYGPDAYDVFLLESNNLEMLGYSTGNKGILSLGDAFQTVESIKEMRNTLLVWRADGRSVDNRMEIQAGETQNGRFYLLWLKTGDVVQKLYESNNYSETYIWNNIAGAGAILILAYWLLLPVWVFLDARRRKTPPLPWALLVLVTNIVGLIVYWIVQNQTGKAPAIAGPVCPACGKPVQEEHPYCPWCATPLHKNCTACGKPLERGWVACPWCGKSCSE